MNNGKKKSPKMREKILNLVSGLFNDDCPPFFDMNGIFVDKFINRDDVNKEAFRFAKSLKQIWEKEYPGKLIRLSEVSQPGKSTVKRLEPQESQYPQSREAKAVQCTSAPKVSPLIDPISIKPFDLTVIFRVPNAKVGQRYYEKIMEDSKEPRCFQFRGVFLSDKSGLKFNESEMLIGTPQEDGEYPIHFHWSNDGKSWFPGKCILFINPDPRSLWKIIEPPTDAYYRKPHTDGKYIHTDLFKMAAASRRGRSHEHSGNFRDDDFFIAYDEQNEWGIMIVADGAGSAQYSRYGAELAVKTAGEHLLSKLTSEVGKQINGAINSWDPHNDATVIEIKSSFHYLFHDAALLAIQAIETEAKAKESPIRDYATTLLATAIKRQGQETFLATFWIGDGAIAAYGPRGKVRLMGIPDGGEYAGQTRFLDRATLSSQKPRISIGCYSDLTAVILMTDGISDPKFETDNGLKDAHKWDTLWDEIKPCLKSPEPDLIEWLNFFSPGYHDDRTIALLWTPLLELPGK